MCQRARVCWALKYTGWSIFLRFEVNFAPRQRRGDVPVLRSVTTQAPRRRNKYRDSRCLDYNSPNR